MQAAHADCRACGLTTSIRPSRSSTNGARSTAAILTGNCRSFAMTTPPLAQQKREGEDVAWQPIETAPKDGRPFLVWEPHYGIRIGIFYERSNHDDWLSYKDAFGGSSKGGMRATHWMPLPAPPSPNEGK